MGIFDKFFSSSPKSYDKYGDTLKRAMTTKEQRLEAIEALEDLKPEYSVPQLLKRFELVVDSGIQDTKEKEQCLKIIVKHGEQSKPFVIDVLKNQRRVSWPIKIAEKIFSRAEYINILCENLSPIMAEFDEVTIERNEEILLALKDIKEANDQIISKVTEFLTCRDDNVRMAALECLEEQAIHSEQAKNVLIDLSKQELTDDNSRFVGVIKSILEARNWS